MPDAGTSAPPTTPATGIARDSLPVGVDARSAAGDAPAPPCTLVIFGAGGDLTKRLLMPALYDLAGSHLLDEGFQIIGVDHTENSDESWREILTATMESFTEDMSSEFHAARIDPAAWGWIRERLRYLRGDFEQAELYEELAASLTDNVVFYLAVAARFFGPIVDRLGAAGLLKEEAGAFRRVVIEKPFGSDLPSARALNARILRSGNENQFYRIDHFLGKDVVQSVLAIRFANGMFEPIWRREYIDHIQITAAETIGVEGRGAFYEPTGALRDMVPNHLFQLLCMTAMEPPNSFDAQAVRDAKAKLLEAVRPVNAAQAARGQYADGTLSGEAIRGYRVEPHIAPESRTETYAALKLEIDNWRWAGVPFYLRTGKRLRARRTEIAVQFKPAPVALFRDAPVDRLAQNILRLQIDPVQGMQTEFNAKMPGPAMRLSRVATAFSYGDFFEDRPNVGYETLLYDCMIGDATLFQRADNIEDSWAVVEPVLAAWSEGAPDPYSAGSEGPASADDLLARDGRHWLPLDQK